MKKILLLTSLLTLSACNDFTQKNLVTNTAEEAVVNSSELLLGQTSLINSGDFTIEKLLANTGTFIIGPLSTELNDQISNLNAGITQYCSTLAALPFVTKDQVTSFRKPLQDSWKEAMLTFHKLELMNFGPAQSASSTSMQSIYSFDGKDKCRVDIALLQVERNRLPVFEVIDNYNVRGLDTIEPLLFGDPNKGRCQRENPRITTWFKKPLLEREQASCKLMTHLMKDISLKSSQLENAWSPRVGNYTASMLNGSAGTSIEVVNQISQSLFTMDTLIKDVKTSYPAGFEVRIDEVVTKCPDSTCPRATEHLYADMALESLQASLEGFKLIFTGTHAQTGVNGYGLDDLLKSRDFATIAEQLSKNIDTAIANIEKIKDQSLRDMLTNVDPTGCQQTTAENRKVEACALVWDIRKITDLLKNDYLVALAELSAPRQAVGDND